MKFSKVLMAAVVCHLSSLGSVRGASFTFTPLSVPGATSTSAFGINDTGQIVGYFGDSKGQHGFVGSMQNGFTSLDPMGSVQTQATAINNRGQVVGWYLPPGNTERGTHGFLYDHGHFITIDVPGASSTQPTGINDAGVVTAITPQGSFEYNSQFSTRIPDAFPSSTSCCTFANGINNTGQIVGSYDGPPPVGDATRHAFVYDGTTFTRIDPPGATIAAANGNNDAGSIVGDFSNSEGISGQSFLFAAGRFSTVSAPGALYTRITDINNAGQIVGLATALSGEDYSFIGAPSSVPEPSSLGMIGLATIALSVKLRTKRSAAIR